MRSEPPKIQDYAAIGDGRASALVSSRGSIDWLCWPQFDSPSLFAEIIGGSAGGCWSIAPAGVREVAREYVGDTNVLRTRFRAPAGEAVLTDFFAVADEADKRRSLHPEHEVIRIAECTRGSIAWEVRFDPRPDYARTRVAAIDHGALGIRVDTGSRLVTLRSDLRFTPDPSGGLRARANVSAEERCVFSLSYSSEAPAVVPALGTRIDEQLESTLAWWNRWAARASYDGPHRREVVRSALALKLLSHAPSGAIVAAPTTSLPERIGGDRNWDYRFCWLRDAAFTARALLGLGYREETEAFVGWLLHATRLTLPELRVLYDVWGEPRPREDELRHFGGYRGSRPVRIGNKAATQLQLDVYGEVIEAVARLTADDGELDRETQKTLRSLGEYVCRHWQSPDHGIWESREPRRHYTHSKLLCWVALDRLLDMATSGQLGDLDREQCGKNRRMLRRTIESNAWNSNLQSYVSVLGGDRVDASLLRASLFGFERPSSERMQLTRRRIEERLRAAPGLLYRDEESKPVGEGAFALCSFWDTEFLSRGGGSVADAEAAFAAALGHANDVGLFAEEIDPGTGDALGNFPQAFTHVGVINAALSLANEGRMR